MKIVNGIEFLKLPPGIVYCKTNMISADGTSMPNEFGPICIKRETSDNIWYYFELTPDINEINPNRYVEKWLNMKENSNIEIDSEVILQNDIVSEENNHFVIFNKQEIQSMIDLLNECL